ncbi:MAG: pseudaminic acid synthase [Candidatus Nealsonbacteria bacterium]|nr:pseudaminic acid synthase [Candidatus Nealsonbacteria bacterium]
MNDHPVIQIVGRKIGLDYPCFVVAEMSGNHQQKFEEAEAILRAAAKAGADAVKLQHYLPETMTLDSKKEWFVVRSDKKDTPEAWAGQPLFDLYKIAYTPWDWYPKLKKVSDELGIILFSTPFDATAVDYLEKHGAPCYKIASYEATDIPLLAKAAKTKKPVIISVGFASRREVDEAVKTLRENGAKEIAVLHCVTGYSGSPKDEEMNLRTIRDIRERFGVVSGFSNNNAGIDTSVTAAIAGASILEQHLTLERAKGAIDSAFSIEPDELTEMVRRIRRAEKMLGIVHYGTQSPTEEKNKHFRRSLWAVKNIKKGEGLTKENVRVLRPQVGLLPKFYNEVLGKTAAKDIEAVTPLTKDLIA